MGRYSSDSNSRGKNRNRHRYYNHKYKSSSTSSSENSRHSRRHQSKISESRYHKKSKHRHRSGSSSDYSSKYKRSCYSHRRKESNSKKKYRRRSSSSSSNSQSTISNKSYKNNRSSKTPHEKKKSPLPQLPIIKDDSDISHQKNVYDLIKKENMINQINEEGFLFEVYKPSLEQKEQSPNVNVININDINVPQTHEEIVQHFSAEDSTFLISNRERLLNAKYKLLTKQERIDNWAKILFDSYQTCDSSQNKDENLN